MGEGHVVGSVCNKTAAASDLSESLSLYLLIKEQSDKKVPIEGTKSFFK